MRRLDLQTVGLRVESGVFELMQYRAVITWMRIDEKKWNMEYERKEQGRTLALSPLPLAILGLKFNVVGAFRAITAAS
jgi:hypothetical protein